MLVWLIGKPGAGKTTVGELLRSSRPNTEYYSFSSLLKKFQPEPTKDGFAQEARNKVYSFLLEESQNKLLIVSGNPYTKTSFNEMYNLDKDIIVFNFELSDIEALRRLNLRNREVSKHEGVTQEDRLANFNKKIVPEIEEIIKNKRTYTFNVENKTPLEVMRSIEDVLMVN